MIFCIEYMYCLYSLPKSNLIIICFDGVLSPVWSRALPAGRAKLHSWLSSACTSWTCLEEARSHSSSHATSGKGRGLASGSPSACYEGISCRGAHPPAPSLWCCDQTPLWGDVKEKWSSTMCSHTFDQRSQVIQDSGWIQLYLCWWSPTCIGMSCQTQSLARIQFPDWSPEIQT